MEWWRPAATDNLDDVSTQIICCNVQQQQQQQKQCMNTFPLNALSWHAHTYTCTHTLHLSLSPLSFSGTLLCLEQS